MVHICNYFFVQCRRKLVFFSILLHYISIYDVQNEFSVNIEVGET